MNVKRVLAICVCAGFAAPAMAQSFRITHNVVDDVIGVGTTQCAGGTPLTTGQNTVWRAFDLAEFGLGDITVREVVFGIEVFHAPSFGHMIDVKVELFQAPGGSEPAFGLQRHGDGNTQSTTQSGTRETSIQVEGCIDAGSTLVVAITPQDFGGASTSTGDVAFLGSNSLGETGHSYLSSTDCDLLEPTTYTALGFPEVHILMSIIGDEGHDCEPDCYADCDESGALDFFDFLCFQNAFASGAAYADCDDSGSLDFFDFLCFQNEFASGCL